MKFHYGTDVINQEGEKVGEVEAVVLDPSTEEITNLIIRKGFLLTEDKVLPISLVETADEEEVKLHPFEGDIDDLPPYKQAHFVQIDRPGRQQIDERLVPMYSYPPIGFAGLYPHPFVEMPVEERNIPLTTKPVKAGARVTALGGEHVGNVEEVIFDPETDRATHFIISKGLLVEHEKLIPVNWIKEYGQDKLELYVDQNTIKNLPDHHFE